MTSQDAPTTDASPEVGRRTVLQVVGGAGALAAGASLLAACGGSGSAGGSSGGDSGGAAAASPVSIPVSQVPVGGGVLVNSGAGVALVQPTAGQFKAYSAVCPHQGCQVNSFTATTIVCPCHGSAFSVTDGAVLSGPAPKGLTAMTATVQGSNVVVS